MRHQLSVVGLSVGALLMTNPDPAHAQRVAADIRIGARPVVGHVTIGDPGYGRPRSHSNVVVVERRSGRPWFWQARYDRRPPQVVVYYDTRQDRYYDNCYRDGLEEVRVYREGNRYYRYDDRYNRRDDRGRRDHRDRDRDDHWRH